MLAVVPMRRFQVDRDNMGIPMAHPAFSGQHIGKGADFLESSSQYDGLETHGVIKVDVHGRDGQVMMIMLQVR